MNKIQKFLTFLGSSLLFSMALYAAGAGQFGDPTDTVNRYLWVKNADAVAHGVGSVVIWSDASGVIVSTTTSAAAKTVAGIVAYNSLPASGYGFIQIYGYHSAVKVVVATVSGDMLNTSTTAESTTVNNSGTASGVVATALETTTSSTTCKAFIRAE